MARKRRDAEAPDLTPLIDVVFLLLIFFMVSTVFKKDELALLLNLPKSQEGESIESQKKIITIELNKNEVAINGKKITFDEISQDLDSVKDKKIPVEIRIDKEVKYERIVKLFDKLKEKQLNNISLVTEI